MALLARNLLRPLEAEVHIRPLLVQIGHNVGVRDSGAVLALFDTLAALSLSSLALVALCILPTSASSVLTAALMNGGLYL